MPILKLLSILACAALFSSHVYCVPSNVDGPRELRVCHGLEQGAFADAFKTLVELFENENPGTKVTIKKVHNYNDTKAVGAEVDLIAHSEFISAGLAARMDRGEDTGYTVVSTIIPELPTMNWLGGTAIQYGSRDQSQLYAMPFNPSMGIVYFNVDLFKNEGVELDPNSLPKTWDHIFKVCEELVAKGKKKGKKLYGFTFPWSVAYTLEYYASLHQIPMTEHSNGFNGRPKFWLEENAHFVDFFARIFEASRNGVFHFVSDVSREAEAFFAKGECGILMQGSGRRSYIEKALNEGKPADTAPHPLLFTALPYDMKALTEELMLVGVPAAPKIGGTALWVHTAAKDKPELKAFLQFLARPDIQAEWTRMTGYMPATGEANTVLKERGYYAHPEHTHVMVAVEQASRPSSQLSHVRIPHYDVIRTTIFQAKFKEYLELAKKVEGDKKDPFMKLAKAFLIDFSKAANTEIDRALGKPKPKHSKDIIEKSLL